ncbi:MAG: AAA family ATPase [Nitrososphaerales archaeon]
MIESVQLTNFISHKDTELKFDNGVTLFIGHNGSGKSSVIDAVTFALYGQHTRKSNKNLIKRGCNSSLVQVEVTIGGRKFKAIRGLNPSGQLINAKLIELKPDGMIEIVTGERKQFAESVVDEVTKVLGLDYSKLRVAAMVQQGELDTIIKAQPREFKELVNSLFGLDKLDFAFQSMKELIQLFRAKLRSKIGYDDLQISDVNEELDSIQTEYKEALDELKGLEEEKRYLVDKIKQLNSVIEKLEPLNFKINELNGTESALLNYISSERTRITKELAKKVELVNNAKSYLQVFAKKESIESKLAKFQKSLSLLDKSIQNVSNDIGKLRGFLEFGDKLQIIHGRCPVCNSQVDKINKIYDTSHIRKELQAKTKAQKKLHQEKESLKVGEQKLRREELEVSNAESFLKDNKIHNIDDVGRIDDEIESKKSEIEKIPEKITKEVNAEQLAIDDYSKGLATNIAKLRKEVKNFDIKKYQSAKKEQQELLTERLPNLEEQLGEYRNKVKQAQNELDSLKIAAEELEKASQYVKFFESIRNSVYNRDGVVGMSLRTWALKTISQKASEYTAMFNMSISRLELKEKARDVSVECYGRSGAIDMESLSGGEKVAVALALRLGMAYVMGSGRLDFIVLDEPTMHLDEERRKSLVRIITEAFRTGLGPLSQMIIITHDAEIFENADVDCIYKFVMNVDGTQVSLI